MSSPEEVEVGEAAAASAAAVEKPPPSNENLEEPKAAKESEEPGQGKEGEEEEKKEETQAAKSSVDEPPQSPPKRKRETLIFADRKVGRLIIIFLVFVCFPLEFPTPSVCFIDDGVVVVFAVSSGQTNSNVLSAFEWGGEDNDGGGKR